MNVVKDPYPYFECLNTLNGHLGEVTFVAFGSNDRTLVSGSLKTIKVWNLETGEEITTLIKVSRCSNIGHIALSADRQILVCTNGRGIIKVWNLMTGQQLRTLKAHSGHVISTALSQNGQTLATGSYDDTIKVWNLRKGQESCLLVEPELNNDSIALSPDGQTLVYGTELAIKVWNWKTRETIHTLEGHLEEVYPVAISANGQLLVSGSWDETIKVWNLLTGQEIYTLEGHSDFVSSVAISANGQLLVSGSWDKTIKVWGLL